MLGELLGCEGFQIPSLEGFGGAAAQLHGAEAHLNALGELLASKTLHAFHLFFHTTIGPDSETDGALGHPGSELIE